MARQYGRIGSLLRSAKIQAPDWLEQLPALPRLARETLELVREGELVRRADQQAASAARVAGRRRLTWAGLGAVLVLSAAIVHVGAAPTPTWAGWPVLPLASLTAGLLAVVWSLRRG
jgi:hypothetical protein